MLRLTPASRAEAIARPPMLNDALAASFGFPYRFGLVHGRLVALPIGYDQNG
jgi:hypothetical protein